MSTFSEDIAKEILSVQPMDEAGKAFKYLYDHSRDEKDLIADGYKPVSKIGLMYIKDGK